MWMLGLVGLNHVTAPVDIRERFAFPSEKFTRVIAGLADEGRITGGVWLQTCNRSEFYYASDEPDAGVLKARFAASGDLAPEQAEKFLYQRTNRDVVRHLYRVVSGLDSMIMGEPQIFGQVKAAYEAALLQGTTDPLLNELFQRSFNAGKRVRTDTGIGEGAVSVSFAAVELARKVFGDLGELEILFIGAGEMAELALTHLKENGLQRIHVANRTVEKAGELASRFGGEAHGLDAVPDLLARTDLVLSCTASPAPLVDAAMAREALRRRRQAPMVFIDMAVPADIAREVGVLEGAYLYTIDDLRGVVEQNLRERARRMEVAEKLVEEEAEKFMDRWASLKLSPLIQEIHAHVQEIQRQELEKFTRRHPELTGEQVKDLEAYTSSLLAKLLHSPLAHIKRTKPEKRTQLLIKKYLGLGEK